MFRISCFADEISPDLNEQVRVMKYLGLKYVEFRSAWDKSVIDLDDAELAEVKKIFFENGISVSSIGSPIGKVGIDCNFEDYLEKYYRAIRAAHFLDTKNIRIFSFYNEGMALCGRREKTIKRLIIMLGIAKREGIVLCHENEDGIYGQSSDHCMDMLDTINDAGFRAVIDPSNFVVAGEHPFESLKRIHRHIEYVHAKDSVFNGEIVPAGKGDGQMREVLDFLRYHDGMFVSLEPHLVLAGKYRGFSGEDLFVIAYNALIDLLKKLQIDYC